MKNFLFIFLFGLSLTNIYSQSNSNNLLASCCLEGGRCTGSAYCSACKNCSGCKHCAKNGGSCGVCSRDSRNTFTSQKNNISSYTSSYSRKLYSKGDDLLINSTALNIREGPSTKYKILEKLTNKSTLLLIENVGSWLKVKVKETETIGYVFYKYVSKK